MAAFVQGDCDALPPDLLMFRLAIGFMIRILAVHTIQMWLGMGDYTKVNSA